MSASSTLVMHNNQKYPFNKEKTNKKTNSNIKATPKRNTKNNRKSDNSRKRKNPMINSNTKNKKEHQKLVKQVKKVSHKIHILLAIFILLFLVVLIALSYSYFKLKIFGEKNQIIKAGNINLILNEKNTLDEIISYINYPVTDEVGKTTDVFEFSIENPNDNDVDYTLYLMDNTIDSSATRISDSKIKYFLEKNDSERAPQLLSELSVDSNGRILDSCTIKKNTVNNYTLRFWVDYDAGNEVMGQKFSVKLFLVITQAMDTIPISEYVFNNNIGENCKTYDDGTDTFLVGQCSNNYVWYSGKLWRIVSKNNETQGVKIITENQVTVIPYNLEGKSTFENSYVDQWLNQDFLATLHDYDNYLLKNSLWDSTLTSNYTEKPTGDVLVKRTVGLLNAYEHNVTYNNSDGLATSKTSYLNNDTFWNLITPSSSTRVRTVNQNGTQSASNIIYGNGIRPVVILKPNLIIESGSGSEQDPYILEGDKQETINGETYINTRYSGEYVIFDDQLYRIVNVEDGLTKITSVDKLSSLTTRAFDSSKNNEKLFSNATIKNDLNNYYENLNSIWKNMVQTNTTWYLGGFGDGGSYKLTICKEAAVDISTSECIKTLDTTQATIGLARVGEFFTSQISKTEKLNYWTLTPYADDEFVRFIGNSGDLYDAKPDNYYTIKPSLYLKSNVIISNDNVGNGMYDSPYTLSVE